MLDPVVANFRSGNLTEISLLKISLINTKALIYSITNLSIGTTQAHLWKLEWTKGAFDRGESKITNHPPGITFVKDLASRVYCHNWGIDARKNDKACNQRTQNWPVRHESESKFLERIFIIFIVFIALNFRISCEFHTLFFVVHNFHDSFLSSINTAGETAAASIFHANTYVFPAFDAQTKSGESHRKWCLAERV
jgi:hypothetical protein